MRSLSAALGSYVADVETYPNVTDATQLAAALKARDLGAGVSCSSRRRLGAF